MSRLTRGWAVGVLLALAGSAPVLAGPSSWVAVPTPDTVAPGSGTVDFSTEGRDLTGVGCDRYLNTEFGVTPRVEAGVDFCTDGDQPALFNLKWRCLEEARATPAVAVGVLGVASGETAQPYLILSHGFGRGRWGAGAISDESRVVGMLGLDYSLTSALLAVADHVGGSDGATSAGLSWQAGERWSLTAARVWERTGDERRWYLDVAYTAPLWR